MDEDPALFDLITGEDPLVKKYVHREESRGGKGRKGEVAWALILYAYTTTT